MLKQNLIRAIALVTIAGAPVVLANVPRSAEITNDTAIYQNLHEIRVNRIKTINFDGDIDRLSAQEKSHHEALPLRLSAPMKRVMSTPYRSGTYKKAPAPSPRRHR